MISFLYFAKYPLPEHDNDEETEHDSDGANEHDSDGGTMCDSDEGAEYDRGEDAIYYNDKGTDEESELLMHARMYGIPALQELARQCFQEAINHVYLFLESILIVFDMVPESDRGLRDLVVSHGISHLQDLLENDYLRASL